MNRKRRWLAALFSAAIVVTVLTLMLAADPTNETVTAARDRAGGFAQALLQLAEPQPPAADPQLKPGEAELCDYGRIKLREDDELPPTVRADAALALQRATAQLIASGNDRERALGLKLRMVAAVRPIHDSALRQRPNCFADASCAASLSAVMASTSAPWVEPMAQLALTTRDADAYAYAFHACRQGEPTKAVAACGQLSAERWAQLDPHNAAPWLYLASEAHERKDVPALEHAAYRISTARVSDIRWGSEHAVMQSLAIREQPRYTQIAVLIDIMGISAAFPFPEYRPVMSLCGAERMNDVNRRQLCSDIGDALVQRDSSLIGLLVGIAIGERAGWPRDRVEKLREEKDALQIMDAASTVTDRWLSCPWFDKFDAWAREVASHGEVGAGRARIKASGRSITELAQNARERMKHFDAEAKALQDAESGARVPPAAPVHSR